MNRNNPLGYQYDYSAENGDSKNPHVNNSAMKLDFLAQKRRPRRQMQSSMEKQEDDITIWTKVKRPEASEHPVPYSAPPVDINQAWVPVREEKMDIDQSGEEVKQSNVPSENLRSSVLHSPMKPLGNLSRAIADDANFSKPQPSMDMDIDTQELIRRLMQEEQCMLCHDKQGYDIGGNCNHKVC